MTKFPRPLALGIIRNGGKILVQLGYDGKKKERFFRLPGGGIEFGEKGETALRREIMEEFGFDIEDILFRGVFENIFTFEGNPGHEIVLVYSARVKDGTPCEEGKIKVLDNDKDYGMWEDADTVKTSKVYPPGVSVFI